MTSPQNHAPPQLNFATQDYLCLSSHPSMQTVHHDPDPSPEQRLTAFLKLPTAITGSGTAAIHHAFTTLLRPKDHLIIDAGSPAAAFAAGRTTQATVHRSPPGSLDGVERRLRRLAALRHTGRVFVMVPAVSAYGSVIADLPGLSDLCRHHRATLILDVSHDLGAIGQNGGGIAELYGITQPDIVLGSLAKTFATPGGFIATRDPDLACALPTTPIALNPARCLAALDIITSPHGRTLRQRLHSNALRLRNHLMADGYTPPGQPSPFVVLPLPARTAFARNRLLISAGVQADFLCSPMVGTHAPRWRLNLSATHAPAEIDDLADLIQDISRIFARQDRATRTLEPLAQARGFTDAVT